MYKRQLYESATAPDAAPIVLLHGQSGVGKSSLLSAGLLPVSYTHLRAHETVLDLVCRLLLEKKNSQRAKTYVYLQNATHQHISS